SVSRATTSNTLNHHLACCSSQMARTSRSSKKRMEIFVLLINLNIVCFYPRIIKLQKWIQIPKWMLRLRSFLVLKTTNARISPDVVIFTPYRCLLQASTSKAYCLRLTAYSLQLFYFFFFVFPYPYP